ASDDMLAEARRATPVTAPIRYAVGRAEALPTPGQSAVAVTAATAAHWFDRPAFYREAARVLRPTGAVAVAENNRIWAQSDLLDGFERILERLAPGYERDFRRIDFCREMAETTLFDDAQTITTRWQREMDTSSFVDWALTSSRTQSAVGAAGRATVERALRDLAERHQNAAGRVAIPYRTELYLARRRAAP